MALQTCPLSLSWPQIWICHWLNPQALLESCCFPESRSRFLALWLRSGENRHGCEDGGNGRVPSETSLAQHFPGHRTYGQGRAMGTWCVGLGNFLWGQRAGMWQGLEKDEDSENTRTAVGGACSGPQLWVPLIRPPGCIPVWHPDLPIVSCDCPL